MSIIDQILNYILVICPVKLGRHYTWGIVPHPPTYCERKHSIHGIRRIHADTGDRNDHKSCLFYYIVIDISCIIKIVQSFPFYTILVRLIYLIWVELSNEYLSIILNIYLFLEHRLNFIYENLDIYHYCLKTIS